MKHGLKDFESKTQGARTTEGKNIGERFIQQILELLNIDIVTKEERKNLIRNNKNIKLKMTPDFIVKNKIGEYFILESKYKQIEGSDWEKLESNWGFHSHYYQEICKFNAKIIVILTGFWKELQPNQYDFLLNYFKFIYGEFCIFDFGNSVNEIFKFAEYFNVKLDKNQTKLIKEYWLKMKKFSVSPVKISEFNSFSQEGYLENHYYFSYDEDKKDEFYFCTLFDGEFLKNVTKKEIIKKENSCNSSCIDNYDLKDFLFIYNEPVQNLTECEKRLIQIFQIYYLSKSNNENFRELKDSKKITQFQKFVMKFLKIKDNTYLSKMSKQITHYLLKILKSNLFDKLKEKDKQQVKNKFDVVLTEQDLLLSAYEKNELLDSYDLN